MEDPFTRAQTLIDAWEARLRDELPGEMAIFDAHVHLGNDVDGMAGNYEELTALGERYDIERCFVFSLNEPDSHPAFSKPNDRTRLRRALPGQADSICTPQPGRISARGSYALP